MPAYGSCAGMIMLADRGPGRPPDQRDLGGIDMTVRRNAFGRQVDSFEGDVRMAGWTAGRCTRCSSGRPGSSEVGDVRVLAGAGGGPADGRIVAVRQGARLLATSFHPEITGDRRVHEFFVAIVRD